MACQRDIDFVLQSRCLKAIPNANTHNDNHCNEPPVDYQVSRQVTKMDKMGSRGVATWRQKQEMEQIPGVYH